MEEGAANTSSTERSGGFASHVTGGILDEYLQEKLASKDPRLEALSDHRNLVRSVLRTVSLIQDLGAEDRSAGLQNYKGELIQTLDKTYKKCLAKFAVDRVLAVRVADSDSKSSIREKLLPPLNLLRLAGLEADSESKRILENPDGLRNLASLLMIVTDTEDSLAVVRILQGLATCSREHFTREYLKLFSQIAVEKMKITANHEMKTHAVRVLCCLCNSEESMDLLSESRVVENVLATMAAVPADQWNDSKCAEFYMEGYEFIMAMTWLRSGFNALLASAPVHVSENSMPRVLVELFGTLIQSRKAYFAMGSGNQ